MAIFRPNLYAPSETAFDTIGLGKINNLSSCVVTEERNGGFELAGTIHFGAVDDLASILFSGIAPGYIILAKHSPSEDPEPFRIYDIDMDIMGNATIKARHISYDLSGYYIIGAHPASLFTCLRLLNGSSVKPSPCPFIFASDITSDRPIGLDVDFPKSVRDIMGGTQGSMLDVYGGEWRYSKYNCNLLLSRAQHTYNVRFGRNMVSFKYQENTESCMNCVLPYYKRDDTIIYGDLISNNGTSPTITSPRIGTAWRQPKLKILDVTNEFTDLEYGTSPTRAQVTAKGQAWYDANKKESVLYSAAVVAVDEPGIEGLDWNELTLCDICNITHPMVGQLQAKIIKTTYNCLTDRYDSIEIGTPRLTLAKRLSALEKGG